MALLLNIETATDICSVALSRDGKIVSLQEDSSGQSHSRLLTTLIMNCLSDGGSTLNELDAIAVSKGPGSYTGLRIGVATAKGLCYGLSNPLISVNTLQSMAWHFFENRSLEKEIWVCPMIDARRMEVYNAFFDYQGVFQHPTAATVITPGIFDEILDRHAVIFIGDGMPKTRKTLENHKNAWFDDQFRVSAAGMIRFSEKAYMDQHFENLAAFEPFYLKDFFTPGQP